MAFDMGLVLNWILFLALFPMAFFWLRRAWRIFIKRDYSEVALKRGEPPKNPQKWAPFTGLTNLVAGGVAAWVILGVPLWIAAGIKLGPFVHFDSWIAIVGVTLWMKIFIDYIISRQAHPWIIRRKSKGEEKSSK